MREKLIELIKDALLIYGYDSYPQRKADEYIADHLIDNGVTFDEDNNVPSKWIPVTERLPEDDLPKGSNVKQIKVLAVLKSWNGNQTVRSQMRYRDTWGKEIKWMWKYSRSDVTHWMPLPQPPEGE